MYKLTQLDGTDFRSGTINYAENIGKIIRVTDYDSPEFGVCGKGIHASHNPNDCFIGAKIPCRAFKVQGIQRIAGNKKKTRYQAVKVLEEITDLDKLFGWKYTEVINPIRPFTIKPPKITDEHIDLLKQWDLVRDSVVASARDLVWDSIGNAAVCTFWPSVADAVKDLIVDTVRDLIWRSAKPSSVGRMERNLVRDTVRDSIWAYVGSMFPNIKKWEYIDHKPGEYPFQPVVDLWKQGLIPSFDGKTWRLHGGKKAKVLWEGEI